MQKNEGNAYEQSEQKKERATYLKNQFTSFYKSCIIIGNEKR